MQITYIETNAITNEVLRAFAGAHRLCVGYPDGVPETWRDVVPVKQGGDQLIQARLAREAASKDFAELSARFGLWLDGTGAPDSARARDWRRYVSYFCAGEIDPAALLGPAAEPVDWPEDAGDEEC